MKANGIKLRTHPEVSAQSLTLYIDGDTAEDMAAALALSGEQIEVDNEGAHYATYCGYVCTSVTRSDGYVTAKYALAVEPNVQGAIDTLMQTMAAQQDARVRQEAVNAEVAERLDDNDMALAELAGIIAGEE